MCLDLGILLMYNMYINIFRENDANRKEKL